MADTLVDNLSLNRTPLKQYFGIEDPYDDGWGKDIDYLSGWADKRGLSKEDMLLELKKIELKLGAPYPGENRIHRVKHYLSLDEKLSNDLKEISAFERGNNVT